MNRQSSFLLMVCSVALVSACASSSLTQPMVSDRVSPTELIEAHELGCRAPIFQREARETCVLLGRLEGFRNEQVSWRSYLNAAIIALGGHVAYQSTRSAPSRALASVSAVGVTAYAIGSLSLPERRALAYGGGARALSCALSVYNAALSSSAPSLVALRTADSRRADVLNQAFRSGSIDQISLAIDAIGQLEAMFPSPTLAVDAQLGTFATKTIEAVNEILQGSLPNQAQAETEVARLSNQFQSSTQLGFQGVESLSLSIIDSRFTNNNALTPLVNRYLEALLALASAPPPSLNVNFSECAIVAPTGGAGAYVPLDLGPGNTWAGKQITISAGAAPHEVPLLNGRMPMSATVDEVGQAAQVKVEIIVQGAVLLRITPPEATPESDVVATVTITDAAGAVRRLRVKIPK